MGMGYQGFVKAYCGTGPADVPVVILTTGSSVNMVLEPIMSTAVWGAGWYNAATSAHYADAALRYEGSVDFELAANDSLWDFLAKWAIAERAFPRSLDISPDGARVAQYRAAGAYTTWNGSDINGAWNTSINFTTSEGSFVTSSAGLVALNRAQLDPAGGTNFSSYTYILQKKGVIASDCAVFSLTNPLNPLGTNVNPIPFWRTNAQLLTGTYSAPFTGGDLPQANTETVDWSIDVTQNQVILYTCSGSRLPRAVLMGAMGVSGNVTLYNQAGVFDPITGDGSQGTITSPYLYADNTWFRVEISGANGGSNSVYIELPAAMIQSDDYSIKGQSDVTNRAFSLTGLGGRCENNIVMPPCIMSDYTGVYIAP